MASGERAPCPPLNFGGPGRLDLRRCLTAAIQTGEQFGRDIRSLLNREGQCFLEKSLRPRRHEAIVDLDTAAQQPHAAAAAEAASLIWLSTSKRKAV